MAKRHKDAWYIAQGACNPSGIAHSIIEACREIRDEGGGTEQINADAAVRLMVHQLGYLTNIRAMDDELGEYSRCYEACIPA